MEEETSKLLSECYEMEYGESVQGVEYDAVVIGSGE
jgi:hypothetical protein